MGEYTGAETRALVLIKTELGTAKDVATAVSTIDGVCWAIVVTGPYDVVAAVKVSDNKALGEVVVSRIQTAAGVHNPTTLVMTSGFGQNGFP